ncbi:hypothetical protein JCM8547_006479 [Rhodosporidiobolus lusitaniae]
MSIQAIDTSSVHRLTSGQVVIDLQTAVKELVENALDAEATNIKISFKEHGLEAFEVEDNGKGIDKDDWEGIALKHHTSKLTSFSDLASVSTLGFRGEALSSLCGTATLSLVTSSASTAPVGTSLTFEHSGRCIVGGKAARNKGTTVKVERLFENLPVRRKELQKNVKREFGKAVELVQAYAIVCTGVRFEVKNSVKGRPTQTHLQTTAGPSVRSTFSCVYAPKELNSLLDLNLTLEVETEKSVLKRLEGAMESTTTIKVKGLISKPSSPHGRTASNRQFYYVNGRPFSPTKIAKSVNEVYKSFNANQFPTVVADFQLPPDAYDVNVSPDKRTIFMHSEGNLISALKAALSDFFGPSQSTYTMKQIVPSAKGSSSNLTGANSSSATNGSPSASQEAGRREGTIKPEEGGEEERPRKRRKSSPAFEPDEGGTGRDEAKADGEEEVDESGDVSMDASFLSHDLSSFTAAENPFSSTSASLLNHQQPHSSDRGDLALPVPPSPIRRAFPPGSSALPSHPSSASALEDLPDFGIDSGVDLTSVGVEPSEDKEEQPEAGPSSPRPRPRGGELFRSSPSPNPPRPRSPSPSRRPSSPSPPPAPPGASAAPAKFKQPTLSFLAGSTTSLASLSAGKKSKAKGKAREQEPAQRMASRLKRFVRGSQGVEGEEEEEEEEVGDEEGGEEQGGEATGEEEIEQEDELEVQVAEVQDEVEELEIEVVEPSPAAPAPHDAEDDNDLLIETPPLLPLSTATLDFTAASCTCVHGSQENDDDDSDIEISEPVKPSSSSSSSLDPPPAPAQPLFGSAPAEVVGTVVAADTSVELDLEALEAEWSAPLTPSSSSRRKLDTGAATWEGEEDGLAGAGIGEKEDEAEATLSRVVSKEDFEKMEVLGQFNLGFIIARRRVRVPSRWAEGEGEGVEVGGQEAGGEVQDDLFIIDQHASDEKYNFETLQSETVIQSQRLLAPRILNLPSHDEITAMEHVDLLRLNGFDVLVDEDADVGERVKLLAQPVSKDTTFGVGDFEELLDLIANRSSEKEIVRPSKARRMFASRACRKSVMIGRALNVKQMTQIVRHMGGMDQPWACPHGRPTMRWLFGLGGTTSSSSTLSDPRADLRRILEAYD